MLCRLRKEHGTSILFVTHDMGVVSEIADRVAVMRRGHILESGPLKSVFDSPQNAYTQELLAAVPTLVPRAPRAPGSGNIALATDSLWKIYDPSFFLRHKARPAVVKVNLRLETGRTLGIVGESGSGKSTLARCLLRLIEPSEGEIYLGGVDFTALSRAALKPHRRDIQIVVQDPYRALNPRLKIVDIIMEGPVNYGIPRKQAAQDAADLLSMVGLPPEVLHAYPHQLSGGQRQRIALARALALKPKVLVADEAVSALDMTTQAQILRLLVDLQDRLGLAILFITHDLRVAAQICDDVAIMHEGRIVEHGKAADVLTKPRHAYTQSLIDAAPGRHWKFAAPHTAAT
jgi:peptide/nickel transport system ATP-binding protein